MRRHVEQKILGTKSACQFIGRDAHLQRLLDHAISGHGSGMLVGAVPGAGATELLKQVYDRLFRDQSTVIPFYFGLRDAPSNPQETALRYMQEFVAQTVAFRRRDPSILDAAPELRELAELAVPEDSYWIDRLIESCRSDLECGDERTCVRSLLSAPLRAATHGARIVVMVDGLHRTAHWDDDDLFLSELCDIFSRAEIPFILSGARRFLFGLTPGEILEVEPLDFESAGALVESLSASCNIPLNDQTRDLLAIQLDGSPAATVSFFSSAMAENAVLETFNDVERVYTDDILGGLTYRHFERLFDQIVPGASQKIIGRLLDENLGADRQIPLEYWRKHAGLDDPSFRKVMHLLNIYEFINIDSDVVSPSSGNIVISDIIRARSRLSGRRERRAVVVGDLMTEYLKRAPQILARHYRRRSAIGLRSLLGAFRGQQVAAATIDYASFKADLKGLSDAEITAALDASEELIALPQIIYTADSASYYPAIREIVDDERSAVARGFEDNGYRDEIVWITAEIDSKLEATAELAEFWCDRLEMIAVSCGFDSYKLWLVAPEGFDEKAAEILRARRVFGSSRKQTEILRLRLTGKAAESPDDSPETYEIVIPMGENTEMIAAHAIEEIARKHSFPAKAINQIKTALVEACINASEHSLSPDRRIHQKFIVDDNRITVIVSNRGLRLIDKMAAQIEPDTGRRGWGLKLMRGLMDEVKIEQTEDGTKVTMKKVINK